MTRMVTGQAGEEPATVRRMSDRWFRSRLELVPAQALLYRVLRLLYPGAYIEGPRLRDPLGPFTASRRRPDFAASLITGQMSDWWRRLPIDAHIEVRLYAEPDGTTVYIGIGVLGRSRPLPAEARMLADFVERWTAHDPSLTPVPDLEYAI